MYELSPASESSYSVTDFCVLAFNFYQYAAELKPLVAAAHS